MSAQVLAGITSASMGGDRIGGTIRVNPADSEFAEECGDDAELLVAVIQIPLSPAI